MSGRVLAAAAGTLVAIAAVLAIVFWDYDVQETKRIMLATSHQCPAGAVEKIERAGEVGWLRLCMKGEARHGPFTYWKKQHKYAEGVYVDGRQVGKVSYFDETGKATRVEEHPK
ncbi:MAG TPA: hypothetical protein VFO57_02895 [Burkholderiales bacterium]|nr:hypothetical protein [Burkholderiales bacterium]